MIVAVLLMGFTPPFAQEGTLDVLDGETLFEGGWLVTLGGQQETREGLRRGTKRVDDPLDRRLTERTAALGVHYGLRYDVQLSAIVPWIDRALRLDDPTGPDRLSAHGPGDIAIVAKWRVRRWDDVGTATNLAVLAGLEMPTGADGERSGGALLPPDLQPGSGSWDPSIGAAITHEPGRWRFNAAALYKRNGKGAQDYKAGDELFMELAAGNRFWLEPYPGPFMRLDALLRYRFQGRASDGGASLSGTDRDVLTAGATLAFRPRPSLDFQLFVEIPVWQDLGGTQLEKDVSVFFAIGFRM